MLEARSQEPPQDLFHPVLPAKINNKLLFALCYKCAIENNELECHHTEDERSFTGTWVLDELVKALEKGYKIVEIYTIWEYCVEQYDSIKRAGSLFTEMMNKFLRIK